MRLLFVAISIAALPALGACVQTTAQQGASRNALERQASGQSPSFGSDSGGTRSASAPGDFGNQ
jgi:hypothetical protein